MNEPPIPGIRRLTWLLLLLVIVPSGCGLIMRQATIAYITVDTHLAPKHTSMEIDRSFIERYQNRVTIRTAFTIDKVMAVPLPAVLDGDIHFAGRSPQVNLPIVAEIANAREEKAAVDVVTAFAGTGRSVRINGVWRIWPEHAGHSRQEQGKPLPAFDTDNPAHVFELHPVIAINRLPLRDAFKPVEGFVPGDAERTFGIFQRAPCTLRIGPKTVSIATETGLYNDVEFVAKIAGEPQLVVRDGRFVTAAALDLHGKVLVERLRMVFAKGTPPERAVRLLKAGGLLHVYGIPRLDFAEISRRMKEGPTNPALLTQPLPYEIVILGVFPSEGGASENARRWSTPIPGASLPFLQREEVVRRVAEDAGERQRQGQTRLVALPLDRVDALPRDPDRLGELLLRPSALGAELFDPVLNGRGHDKLAFHGIVATMYIDVKYACQMETDAFPRPHEMSVQSEQGKVKWILAIRTPSLGLSRSRIRILRSVDQEPPSFRPAHRRLL